jgi:transcription elongation factor GreA
MPKTEYLSKEGLAKLQAELIELRGGRRNEVADRIAAAREFGDLSENAEYEEAKNEQAFLEGRIATIEALIHNAEIIGDAPTSGKVGMGSRVRIRYDDGEEDSYTLVGSSEANPAQGKISHESPVGAAAMGHMVGDRVSAPVPRGTISFEIVSVD